MKAPCKNCEARAPKCHSVCEKYKAYRASLVPLQKEKQKYYNADALKAEAVYKRKWQHRKEHTK